MGAIVGSGRKMYRRNVAVHGGGVGDGSTVCTVEDVRGTSGTERRMNSGECER